MKNLAYFTKLGGPPCQISIGLGYILDISPHNQLSKWPGGPPNVAIEPFYTILQRGHENNYEGLGV